MPSLCLGGFQIRCLTSVRGRVCFSTPNPSFSFPPAPFCTPTLVILLLLPNSSDIKKNKLKKQVKKPVAVNLVPGTLVFSPANTLLFLIPLHLHFGMQLVVSNTIRPGSPWAKLCYGIFSLVTDLLEVTNIFAIKLVS